MTVEFTYNVTVTVDDEDSVKVEKALLETARKFDLTGASVDEIDAVKQEDEDDEK